MTRHILFAVALTWQSLAGLPELSIHAVNRQSNDEVPPAGFVASVQEALEGRGIRVVPYTPGTPSLVIFIGEWMIDLELRQGVAVPRVPGRVFEATTWWTGGLVSCEELSQERVPHRFLDDFVVAWVMAQDFEQPSRDR